MADLTTRAYQPSDAPALTDLINTIEKSAGGHPGYTADEIEAMAGAMVRDPATDSRLDFAEDGTLVAAGVVTTPPEGGFRVDLFGGVHPDWRGRGIGREVLGWQLDRAGEIHRDCGAEVPWQAETGAVVGDRSAIRLLERFGLTPARYFFEMLARTADVPTAPLPPGLRSEPYRAELAEALHAAHVEAFDDHWGYQRRPFEEWVGFTVNSETFRPELSRLAFDGSDIAGYLLSYDDASPERLYIGQVGTRRPWRRRGLAAALLAEVLAAAGGAGKELVGLEVDADSPTGAVGVYERVGFEVEYRSVAYRRPIGG